MPRKKKSGQSPARVPGLSAECGVSLNSSGSVNDRSMAKNEAKNNDNWGAGIPNSSKSTNPGISGKEEIVNKMQEMFSHLDPEVIYLVLNECDFRVENAMDALLELSVAAEGAAPPPAVSGFELAAALLYSKPQQSDTTSMVANGPQELVGKGGEKEDLDTMGTHLTAEFDTLIEQEIETLSTQPALLGEPFPSVPQQGEKHPPCQALPELLQSTVVQDQRHGLGHQVQPDGSYEFPRNHSPISGLSFTGGPLRQECPGLLDFSHLATDSATKKPTLDLGSPSRPSAFQAYKKSPMSTMSAGSLVTAHSHREEEIPGSGGGSGQGQSKERKETLAAPSLFWNTKAPEFHPRPPGPAFITPVVLNPTAWRSQPTSHWFGQGPVQQAPLKPSATIPKSWTLPAAPKSTPPFKSTHLEGKVLVLLRGAPGSGKSTLARTILNQNPGGVVLSSDEFFMCNGQYRFNPELLTEAHEWNRSRAKNAFEKGLSPIIIDNTNMQAWEMKPYVALGKQHNYKVLFREPDTWWKFKPKELERRTKHGVPKEKIRRMLERYERHVSVESVMCSFDKRPELSDSNSNSMTHLLPETSLSQPLPSEIKPDLVEEPYLSLSSAQSHTHGHTQLFSSLPDVSSVGRSSVRKDSLVSGSSGSLHGSSASLPAHGQTLQPAGAEQLDSSALDWELDTLTAPGQEDQALDISWQEPGRTDEEPVAFSESIGQRVRRHRAHQRQTDTHQDKAALLESSDALPTLTGQVEREEEGVSDIWATGSNRVRPELLDFVGDWPSEGLGPREQRQRAGHGKGTQQDEKSSGAEDGEQNQRTKAADAAEQNKTEFQKLLDLLQSSTDLIQNQTSPSSGSPVDLTPCSSSENLSQDPESGYQGTLSPSLSSGEGQDQKVGKDSRPELLDCVTDWTLSDITPVRETPESAARPSVAMALPPLETTQTNVFTPKRGAEQQSRSLEDQDSPSSVTKDLGSAGQKAESPGGGGGVEAVTLVGSQERRLRQNRRSGKQCKLALTFTNNSPTSPRPLLESPQAPARPIPITPETPTLLCTGRSVQTDPQDFALLWRLDHQQQADVSVVCPNVIVLSVKNNFQSKPASMKESPGHQEVPYRVVHDKGTQVEEQELESESSSKFKDLQILSQHFKLVNFDTLEDLYDKCHEDIQWTTNLLLDSGEELFRYDGNDDSSQDDVEQAAKEHLIQGRDIDSNENLTNVHVNWGACGGRGVEQLAEVCSPESEGVGGEAGSGEAEKFPDPKETSAQGGSVLGAQCRSGTSEHEPAPKLTQEAEEDSLKDLPEPEELSIGQPSEETDTSQQVLDSGETKPAGELESGSAGQIDRPQDLDTNQPSPTMPALGDYGALIRELESREEPNNPMSVDEVTQSLLFQLGEMNKREKEAEQREREMERASHAKLDRTPLNIQSLELKIPPELALQLSELFGPVGIDPGSLTPEDCSVQIDLNLARLLHQKWKDTIQERQRQEALSYHLLQESSVHWGESQTPKGTSRDGAWGPHFLIGTDGFASLGQSEVADSFPFMDHWNVPQSHVSLRDIMLEEQVLQEHKEKSRESRTDSRKDGAALLKEQQLYSTFPSIDRHFLNDIFKDHNYSLEQTTQFLRSLLDEGPVKTVVAQDVAPPRDTQRAASSERRHKGKEVVTKPEFQDTEDPEYEDFRTEAMLQRRKQQECFSKAAGAYRQGMKDVASFYAQQGHLHGQKMKEANDRAAMQIFERVNATLLPQNILDLHGLHVDEALYHLKRVLEDKTAEWQQGGCRPKLSVITGKGNHSQGGVARIRPAVIDYLTSHDYMFTEPKCGLLLVTLH